MVLYRKELSLLAVVCIILSAFLVCRSQRITEEAVETFLIGVLLIWYRCRQEDAVLRTVVVPAPAQPAEPPQVTVAVFEPIEPNLVEPEAPIPPWLAGLLKDSPDRE